MTAPALTPETLRRLRTRIRHWLGWEPCRLEWFGDEMWVVCVCCNKKQFRMTTMAEEIKSGRIPALLTDAPRRDEAGTGGQ